MQSLTIERHYGQGRSRRPSKAKDSPFLLAVIATGLTGHPARGLLVDEQYPD